MTRDFDPNETLKEKLLRLGEVKDCRGLGKLLKQMAVATAKAPGKQPHQFLGRLSIPLKVIHFQPPLLVASVTTSPQPGGLNNITIIIIIIIMIIIMIIMIIIMK